MSLGAIDNSSTHATPDFTILRGEVRVTRDPARGGLCGACLLLLERVATAVAGDRHVGIVQEGPRETKGPVTDARTDEEEERPGVRGAEPVAEAGGVDDSAGQGE